MRFIVQKTERQSDEVALMMDALEDVIAQLEAGDGASFRIEAQALRPTARALAGVAGFMQQHILPEATAAGNTSGEEQIRWTIDSCMSMMANLMTQAELDKDEKGLDVVLPPFP